MNDMHDKTRTPERPIAECRGEGAVTDAEVTHILLADGWHNVLPGTFRRMRDWGELGVEGFEFEESESGGTRTLAYPYVGPWSAILAIRGKLINRLREGGPTRAQSSSIPDESSLRTDRGVRP